MMLKSPIDALSQESSAQYCTTALADGGEPKNAPELPIERFLMSKTLGGNRVILVVRPLGPLNRSVDSGADRRYNG